MTPEKKVDLIEDWHDHWHGVLLRVLTERITNFADVQDLAQEVYLRLLRFDKLDLVRNPRTYLYRVAANVAEEWRLKSRQSKPHTNTESIDQPSDEDCEQTLQDFQAGETVRKALSTLPPTCRSVLILHCKDDMTYEQIAVHLGISRRMVKRHVANGYATLREELSFMRSGVNQNVG